MVSEQTHNRMKAIKSKDTSIEILLRKELWKRGLRGYRKNYKKLPGKPDIVYTKQKVAIFCDSEFWHGYDWEENKSRFKNNTEFWHKKIERNMERDKEVNKKLQEQGWLVLRIWESDIKKDVNGCVDLIEKTMR